MFSVEVSSPKNLMNAAKLLIEKFPNERIFAFYGKMGAGKTTFIQAICKLLGTEDKVTSPTFAIINEYKTSELFPLYHFDFYRIKDIEEAFDLGYEDYLYGKNYCFIEWPEKIAPILPDNIVKIEINVLENNNRQISAKTN